ncbi:MAG: GNAT family N-acetyltransferase [Acidimicrobiales bacterium]|jgi:predicted N-acetyltransferase YhbS
MSSARQSSTGGGLFVRPLTEPDLDLADRIFRTAFGTFLEDPEPEKFFGDVDFVRTRWRADPTAAFGAELDGELVGTSFLTNWGSVGFLGPLTVRPDHWDRGVAKRLMEPTMARFDAWRTRHVGLLTFAASPKHVGLYQSFGFWPRYLIASMAMPVLAPARACSYSRFSELAPSERAGATGEVRELTSAVFEGLEVTRELEAVADQKLGETVLVHGDAGLEAVAVCHIGPGTEAGSGTCYVKFGAARPGPRAAQSFGRLIDACHHLAANKGATTLCAGVNFGRERAYAVLRENGFRTAYQGVAMHRPNEPAYDRRDCYVIDDWR